MSEFEQNFGKIRQRPRSDSAGDPPLAARSAAHALPDTLRDVRIPMSLGMQVRTRPTVSPRSERGPAADRATTNINIQVNIERRNVRGRTDTYKHNTSRHRTQRTAAEDTREAHASCQPASTYIHAEDTVSANRSTDGSRRTFRGTGHSKIHDSPLCACTHAAGGRMCARAAMLRSRTHRVEPRRVARAAPAAAPPRCAPGDCSSLC